MKLLTTAALAKAIRGISTARAEATLSLAFHSMVHGNVEALADLPKGITGDLHRDYKALVCAAWSEKDKVWTYNKQKSVDKLQQMGLVFGKSTWEDFLAKAQVQQAAPVVEKTDVEQRAACIKSVERSIVKALALGIDKDVLMMLVKTTKAAE